MGAMLEGVRVIKLSAWEAEVQKSVESARKDELLFVRKSAMFMAGNRALMDASPVCIYILYKSLFIHIYAYIYIYIRIHIRKEMANGRFSGSFM